MLVANTNLDAVVAFSLVSTNGYGFDLKWRGLAPIEHYDDFLGDALLRVDFYNAINHENGGIWNIRNYFWLGKTSGPLFADQLNKHIPYEDYSMFQSDKISFFTNLSFSNKREIYEIPSVFFVSESASVVLAFIGLVALFLRRKMTLFRNFTSGN
ncbi:hypothetical protein O59_004113 [Cellvibrio sp. BR]|nr:hypothetical protein O59_004113 [Cellvibrio sp. BR]